MSDDQKNFDFLKKLTSHCRKNGIKSIKFENVQLEFDNSAFYPESAYKQKKSDTGDPVVDQPYTEEEILMWSVPGEGIQ